MLGGRATSREYAYVFGLFPWNFLPSHERLHRRHLRPLPSSRLPCLLCRPRRRFLGGALLGIGSPYNYIVDPGVREIMGINLKDAVVIFDEVRYGKAAASSVPAGRPICLSPCVSAQIPERGGCL